MIESLHIENIAVVKSLDVDFSKGMTVLTGETGAGKSIIIDSLNLLLGGRADRELIRNGESRGEVSALFSEIPEGAAALLAELGFSCPDGTLMLSRAVTASGSSARLNGRAITAGVLREIASTLFNIHGQNDNQKLLDPQNHIELLDSYAGNGELRQSYGELYRRILHIRNEIDSLERDRRESERLSEMLRFQIADIDSAKNCLRVLKNGDVLAMMPEARLSTVGKFEDIQESTYSFLKKAGVPVYTIKIQGDYFSSPKWGNGIRRNSYVETELDILYTKEDLKNLSVEEIKKGVEERLYYDDFEWLKTKPNLKYKSKTLAEGLENILVRCPKCGAKHSIVTKGREVKCEKCSLSLKLDDRYSFEENEYFENFAKWYEWQSAKIGEEIAKNVDYSLSSEVELKLPSIDGKTLLRSAGHGVCTLNKDGLTYKGTKDGEDVEIHFPLDKIYRLLFGAGEDFEVYLGKEIHYFVPKEKRSCVEWYITSILLYDVNVKQLAEV